MAGHTVEFFFDYASPYAYFGSELVEAVCKRGKADLKWQPMVLGGIFQARETKALLYRPAQRDYMLGDLAALSEVHNVPYKPRTEFLFKSILALRCTLQVPQGPERAKAVHALFRAAWSGDKDLGDPAVTAAALSSAGLDGKALAAGADNPAVKDELKQLTEQALTRGVFGAPTMFLDGKKMFWGHDRLPLLEYYLTRG